MAIKLIDSFQNGDVQIAVVFADTKAEVTDLAAVTSACKDLGGTIGAGSVIYTADGNVAFIKSDETISWQGSTPPVTHPHFTLQDYDAEDHVYYFEEEMTWGEFVESEYNTDAVFSVGEEYILWNGVGVIDGDGIYQSDGNFIGENATYGLE